MKPNVELTSNLELTPNVELTLTPTVELDAAGRLEMGELLLRVHGPPELRRDAETWLTWSGGDDSVCVMRVREAGLLVSSLHVSHRTILADGLPVHTAGIRSVLTDPAFRRKGYARAAMQRAMTFMQADLHVELGLLFSSRMAIPLYTSLGWQIFRGPVWCEQPEGQMNYTERMPDDPPMVLRLPGNSRELAAIDLCGLPW